MSGRRCEILDSIVGVYRSGTVTGQRIEYCNVFGNTEGSAIVGQSCFSADPQFRDPAKLDYRLAETSPCKGKASDSGDIGCRYTPEMIELVQKALELRAKGIIKF